MLIKKGIRTLIVPLFLRIIFLIKVFISLSPAFFLNLYL